jgi:DNA-binding response OmpR family regulator
MPSILVIEDTEPLRNLIRIVLEQAGYTVYEAENGRDGLKQFHATPTDMVITDIYMPDCDGLVVIRSLRAKNPRVKILAMSGKWGPLDMSDAAKLMGANAYLQKPFTMEQLVENVERLFRSAENSR